MPETTLSSRSVPESISSTSAQMGSRQDHALRGGLLPPLAPVCSPNPNPSVVQPHLPAIESMIDKVLQDPKMTKAVLLQLMGMLVNTNDSQIARIDQLNQISIKVLRRIVRENERVSSTPEIVQSVTQESIPSVVPAYFLPASFQQLPIVRSQASSICFTPQRLIPESFRTPSQGHQ